MNENVVARGRREAKKVDFKRTASIIAIIAAVVMLIGLISSISEGSERAKKHVHSKYCYKYSYRSSFASDLEKGKLQSSKMDCEFADGAFGYGLSNYFEGGFILPLLILGVGLGAAYAKNKKSRGYELVVTEENICVTYSDNKELNIPLCSVFSANLNANKDLNVVTSENSYTLQEMEGVDDVYNAILKLMPTIDIKGPANNEQIIAKGYPPAIKPLLLVLLILFAFVAFVAAVASEEFAILVVGAVPVAILLVLYLLAKTPYLAVTDKRVFYVSDFGRKLSLPLDKITVTVTHWWFKQLHIAAPAGRIHLFWVRNTAELYDMITALINEKQ